MDQGSNKPAHDDLHPISRCAPDGDPVLKCPLCSGRGELPSEELFDRLREKDFSRKVESYLANVVEAERKAEPKPGPTFDQDVHTWNCTHFLWRRSPKE